MNKLQNFKNIYGEQTFYIVVIILMMFSIFLQIDNSTKVVHAKSVLHHDSKVNLVPDKSYIDFPEKTPTIEHTVKSGDTLSRLALYYMGDSDLWVDIQELNNVEPSNLQIGTVLKVPDMPEVRGKIIKSPDRPVVEYINQDSVYLLAQLITAEAKGEPYSGKIAVGNVVINRVNSSNFPNTIKNVIFQKGQFSPVTNGSIHNEPTESAMKAAKEVVNGERVVSSNALYFYNPSTAKSKWIFSRTTLATIGNHRFAR